MDMYIMSTYIVYSVREMYIPDKSAPMAPISEGVDQVTEIPSNSITRCIASSSTARAVALALFRYWCSSASAGLCCAHSRL